MNYVLSEGAHGSPSTVVLANVCNFLLPMSKGSSPEQFSNGPKANLWCANHFSEVPDDVLKVWSGKRTSISAFILGDSSPMLVVDL